MTDYTKRLDEILTLLENSVSVDTSRRMVWCRQSESPKVTHARAKQAITSLIKELVAEAKPEKLVQDKSDSDSDYFYAMGNNQAIDQFEENLLKALEEV